MLDRKNRWYKSEEGGHYDWDEYDVDQNISLILMESAVLDVEVFEGEAGVRELEDVWLRCDSLAPCVSIIVLIQAFGCVI